MLLLGIEAFFLPMSGCRNLHVDLGELNINIIHFALAIDSKSFIFRFKFFFADLLGMKDPKSIATQIIRN